MEVDTLLATLLQPFHGRASTEYWTCARIDGPVFDLIYVVTAVYFRTSPGRAKGKVINIHTGAERLNKECVPYGGKVRYEFIHSKKTN